MERSTLIQIKRGGINYMLASNCALKKQELVILHQLLINAEQEQLNIVRDRVGSLGTSWDSEDTETVLERAVSQMQDLGIAMTKVGVTAFIDMDASPNAPNTEGWDCDCCTSKFKSHREFPCCECIRPAGRMFVPAE